MKAFSSIKIFGSFIQFFASLIYELPPFLIKWLVMVYEHQEYEDSKFIVFVNRSAMKVSLNFIHN